MANLRTSMDAAFYDLNIATPQTLHGSARSIPGEPVPLDGANASKVPRMEQLTFLGPGFPLGLIPSFARPLSYSSQKESGSLSLQTLWLRQPAENWQLGLVGQIRPRKLLSSLKAEAFRADPKVSRFKRIFKKFFDRSFYSFGSSSLLELGPSTHVLLSVEKDGQRKNRCTKAIVNHQLPDHDITLEAAWPELFVDRYGKYWNVPESISLNCLSLISKSGLRYRFGIHKNTGSPSALDSVEGQAPASLRPGICAKAAFSYEKSKDLWRNPETKEDLVLVKKHGGGFRTTAYDLRMKEPHAAISGILGATCEAWFGGKNFDDNTNTKRSPFGADLFGSICFAFQQGKFRKRYGDLTRFDARLDLAKGFSDTLNSSSVSPQLNLILQQQVLGPLVFRVNSKVSLGSSSERRGPHIEDVIYSLNYSMRYLESGKVVAWYSPKRNEGMVEVRVCEF
ncbi:protein TRIGALACTOSYLDIACYLGLYCEROL 4, chloroplastic [Cynara cardunculus var. scolymus]|uniref:protein TRIGALACTOSYLDIACYLGLYCEROL 4, chloroplastic n=1 Tax=Cynara cardunculus var. scolymus TaxID=59895 RepID=UPI000D62FAA1|nr:protein TRIGALACTOSYLDIACYLGLYCEROL 4, chloroplastic [Cynara cardunculus var. scolymus]